MEMKRAAQEDTTVSAPILDLAKIFAIVIFFKFESDKKTKNVSLVQNLQCNKSKRGELQKKPLIFQTHHYGTSRGQTSGMEAACSSNCL